MFEAITARGAVVSEYPPGVPPARRRFLARNRLIAALGSGTVIVEAARRSGTLITALRAGQLGRPVMAIPGPATSAMSAGSHLADLGDLVAGGRRRRRGCRAWAAERAGQAVTGLWVPGSSLTR